MSGFAQFEHELREEAGWNRATYLELSQTYQGMYSSLGVVERLGIFL